MYCIFTMRSSITTSCYFYFSVHGLLVNLKWRYSIHFTLYQDLLDANGFKELRGVVCSLTKVLRVYFTKRNYMRVVGKWGYHLRSQESRQILRVGIKWVGGCCLSIFTLRHVYPLSHFSVHHMLRDSHKKLLMKRKSFLPNKYKRTE